MLALLAAATFALNSATARRAVLTGSVLQGIAITVPLGIPCFVLGALALGQLGRLADAPLAAILWLSTAGIAHFVWGRYFIYRAQELIGANRAGTLQQFDLLISLALAIVVLGEAITPLRMLGILLVVGGPALAVSGDRSKGRNKPAGDKLMADARTKEGYICVGLSSLGYGLSPIFTTLGLRALGPGSGMVGGLIAYLAATAAVILILVLTRSFGHVLATGRESSRWYAIAGVSVSVSQMLRFAALSLAPVTVVQPIQRLSKLFLFFFSWIMNREHESFDRRLIVAAVVSLVGAALLSLSAEVVVGLADWPPWLRALLAWRWQIGTGQ